MALLVGCFVEGERLISVASVWDDGLRAAPFQPLAQLSAVIGLVAEHFLRGFCPMDQALRNRAVMRLAACQQDGEKAALSICECMYLRVAAAA